MTLTLKLLLLSSCISLSLLVSCPYNEAASAERYKIIDEHRKVVGDIYDPKNDRRVQIRDKQRRIVGYIEKSGKITDKRRRKIGVIESD